MTEPRTLVAPTMTDAPSQQTELISLSTADLTAGEMLEVRRDEETAIVVLAGTVDVTADSQSLGQPAPTPR